VSRVPYKEAVAAANDLAPNESAGYGHAFCEEERKRYAVRIQQAIDAVIASVTDPDPTGTSDWGHE
jgi:hypothetical protein